MLFSHIISVNHEWLMCLLVLTKRQRIQVSIINLRIGKVVSVLLKLFINCYKICHIITPQLHISRTLFSRIIYENKPGRFVLTTDTCSYLLFINLGDLGELNINAYVRFRIINLCYIKIGIVNNCKSYSKWILFNWKNNHISLGL